MLEQDVAPGRPRRAARRAHALAAAVALAIIALGFVEVPAHACPA